MIAVRGEAPASSKLLYGVCLGGLLLCFVVASIPLIADVPSVSVMGMLLPLAIAFMLVNAAIIVSMLRACRLAATTLERSVGTIAERRSGDPMVRLVDAVETLDQVVAERTGEIERLHHADPLTGLGNRRWLQIVAGRAATDAATMGGSTSMIVLRVEHLQEINQMFGYDVGDATLLAVTDLLHRQLRRNDCIARVSGNEFAVFLAGLPLATAEMIAARLAEAVRATPQPMLAEGTLPVRVATIGWEAGDHRLEGPLARAQAALELQPRGPIPGARPVVIEGRVQASPAYAPILSED